MLLISSGCRSRTLARIEPAAAPRARVQSPASDYFILVASEASDKISRVRYGPDGISIERETAIGTNPVHINGPHGVAFSPDRRFFYVTTGHGTPFGSLWKYATESDSLIARVTLGLFPATVHVTPDGALAYVVNFNLHGPHERSSVSIVSTDEMVEIARVPTCVMPHGSRLNLQGTKHYSACMMDDVLVEIDAQTLAVARHFVVTAGKEHGAAGSPSRMSSVRASDHAHGDESPGASAAATPGACSPTWAQPSVDGTHVFVACNASNEIVDVDAARWTLSRRLPAGNGVYNLAVTPDGQRLVATNKRDQSVSVFDVASGRELARIRTTRRIVHGVVVSPDSRYAFVSAEGVGAEPGAVNVIDLATFAVVASADVGLMAGGIDFWKVEPGSHVGIVRPWKTP